MEQGRLCFSLPRCRTAFQAFASLDYTFGIQPVLCDAPIKWSFNFEITQSSYSYDVPLNARIPDLACSKLVYDGV